MQVRYLFPDPSHIFDKFFHPRKSFLGFNEKIVIAVIDSTEDTLMMVISK